MSLQTSIEFIYSVDNSAACGSAPSVRGGAIVVGTWTHIAGTYDGSTIRIYKNGTLVSQMSGVVMVPSNWMTAGAVTFFNGQQAFYSGEIDELRIWSAARSEIQIRQTMNITLTGLESSLVGYWKFDEGSGQQVRDSSRTGTTGMLGTTAQVQTSDPTWVTSTAPITEPASISFSVPGNGGVVLTPGPSTGFIARVGYASLQIGSAQNDPAGFVAFSLRQAGVLVAEASVPAAKTLMAGRIYAEIGGPVNTGIAFANPNDVPADISFSITNQIGQDIRQGAFTIGPRMQQAAFLNESPFNGGNSIRGTLTFTSSVPVAALALRGFANERSEFLVTTLPVAELTIQPGQTALAHFADGGGWSTLITLVNPTDQVISGNVEFLNQAGQPESVTVDGVTDSRVPYSIPRRSAAALRTATVRSSVRVGSVRIIPDVQTSAPVASGVFSLTQEGVTVSEAGVQSLSAASSYRVFAEAAGALGAVGSVQTGIAISNLSSSSASVTVQVFSLTGASMGTGTLSLPPNGQAAQFLEEIPGLAGLPKPLRAVLRISSNTPIAVIGLRGRTNERGNFLVTTTPPATDTVTASAEVVLPHLVFGGGWNTEVILFAKSAGATSGILRLRTQDGTPAEDLRLTVSPGVVTEVTKGVRIP
jgi:hypothetical protein